MSNNLRKYSFGPGFLIAAAFIGPGTVTTASKAGASFGYVLLWALVFSVLATIILQEMSVRLGVIGRVSLAQALRQQIKTPWIKFCALSLAFVGIIIGNTAYEAGNLLGASLGFAGILDISPIIVTPLLAIIAGTILWFSVSQRLELILGGLVALMSVCFILTALLSNPDWSLLLADIFSISVPDQSTLLIIALIGTTVVPYNLFLHSALAERRWQSEQSMSQARWDLRLAILLGGIISMSILVSAGTLFPTGTELNNASEMSKQLEPLLGGYAEIIFSIGLLAAGLTSAITAPLAAAYTICGLMGKSSDETSTLFRCTWLFVLLIGCLFATISYRPTEAILLAQYANGLLLPLIVVFLIYVMNKKTLLKQWSNSTWQNLQGIFVGLTVLLLALKSLALI